MIRLILSLVCVILSRVTWISDKVSPIEESILSEITARRSNALCISLEEVLVSVLNARICSATTAKPLPASPALAASIEALRARRLVWLDILSIALVWSLTVLNSDSKSCRICSTSEESSDMVVAVVIRFSRSLELVYACSCDSEVRLTISSISWATCSTCELMSVVISVEEAVWLLKSSLLLESSFMPSMITSEPCLFSEASSRTTVIPLIIELLEVLTFSTVETTLSRSALMLPFKAPSDSLRCLIDIT